MYNAGAPDIRFIALLAGAFLMGLFGTLATAGLAP
jgi:hypothetical protein